MARRVYTDIDAEVLLRLGNRSDISATQRGFFIKDAYLNIAMMFKHPQIEKTSSETLASASDTLTPAATDIWVPTYLRNTTDGYPIILDSQDHIEQLVTKPTARPYKYYWYATTFIFDAKADTQKTVKIWYKRKPVDFSGASSSELDELFDPLIIMDAARIGFETVRDFDEAQKQLSLFGAEVASKKIPSSEAKLNDSRQGFRVRIR